MFVHSMVGFIDNFKIKLRPLVNIETTNVVMDCRLGYCNVLVSYGLTLTASGDILKCSQIPFLLVWYCLCQINTRVLLYHYFVQVYN